MPNKNVRLQVGYLDGEGTAVSDVIYDRPVMLVYTGTFESMDGEVTITDHHIEQLASSHNARYESAMSKVRRLFGAEAQVPMRECPPLQLDHQTTATHTIGRVVGPLNVGKVEIEGEARTALFGTARFMGKENVDKAVDGRYTHVSIGATLDDHPTLNELSVTPFPAAPKASLLSKPRLVTYAGVEYEIKPGDKGMDIYVGGQKVTTHEGSEEEVRREAEKYIDKNKGEASMHEKMKKHLMEHRKMSEKDAEEMAKKMSKWHMEKMSMDDEKMGKHMEAADDKEMSRMSDEYDKEMSKLAADEDEDKKKMSAEDEEKKSAEDKEKDEKKMSFNASFVKLAKGIRTVSSEIRKDVTLSAVAARVQRLRLAGKMTPGEIQSLDIPKLASMTSNEIEAAFAMAEAREPVIRFGHAFGTTKAETIDKVAKRFQMAKLELETRMNMPSKRAEAERMMAQLKDEEKAALARVGGQDEESPTKGMLTRVGYDDLCSMLEDKKRHEELKKHLKHLCDMYGEMPKSDGEDDKKMSSVAKRQDQLQNQLNEFIALAAPALGIKLEELN
jgi:hypothetical protein